MLTSKAFLIFVFALGLLMAVSGTPAPVDFCNSKSDGDYRHPNDCSKHIKCSNEISYVFDCPARTKWDDSVKRCEYTSDIPSCNGTPFTCVGRVDGYYRNPDACTSFYVCDEQYTHLMQCPATTHFNTGLQVCDHAANAGC